LIFITFKQDAAYMDTAGDAVGRHRSDLILPRSRCIPTILLNSM